MVSIHHVSVYDIWLPAGRLLMSVVEKLGPADETVFGMWFLIGAFESVGYDF